MRCSVGNNNRKVKFALAHLGKSAAGVTLFELAIAVLVLGVLLSAGINLYTRAEQQRNLRITQDNMNAIVDALSIYAESAGRIPCPADPSDTTIAFGWERGVTAANLQVGSGQFPTGACDTTNPRGIVPFLSLNLPSRVALDGWGHYFTYIVNPQFSRQNDQTYSVGSSSPRTASKDVGTIHARCRTVGWAGRYDAHNISAVKARFCCADLGWSGGSTTGAITYEPWNTNTYTTTSDIVVKFTDGTTTLSPTRDSTTATLANVGTGGYSANSYYIIEQPTIQATGSKLPVAVTSSIAGGKILTPAFVLISHGSNGVGAYTGSGTSQYSGSAGTYEAQNNLASNFKTFYDGPTIRTTGANHFDQVVRWMTQDSLMAAHGAISCHYP